VNEEGFWRRYGSNTLQDKVRNEAFREVDIEENNTRQDRWKTLDMVRICS
jgi:hypothetical protein